MDELIIYICQATFHDEPAMIKRCSVGLANYVFIVEIKGSKYTVRLSTEKNAYNDTVRLLGKLTEIGIPVPRVLYCGSFEQYDYVVLSYIEGEELWAVYKQLTKEDKKILAMEIVHIQREVSLRLSEHAEDWTWLDFVHEILDTQWSGRSGHRPRDLTPGPSSPLGLLRPLKGSLRSKLFS